MSENIEVEKVDYHRNGMSGESFYVVHFMWFASDVIGQNMMGVVFEPDEARDEDGHWLPAKEIPFHNSRVAVFDKDLFPSTEFAYNSWRGDNFASDLYEACRKYDEDSTPGASGNDEPNERHNYEA